MYEIENMTDLHDKTAVCTNFSNMSIFMEGFLFFFL